MKKSSQQSRFVARVRGWYRLSVLRCVPLWCAMAVSAAAQTVFVSNLGQSVEDFRAVGGGGGAPDPITLGMSFTTGGSGAVVDKFTLSFQAANGSPSGFTLKLYDSFTAGVGPSGLVATFTGSDPLTTSNYDFVGSATLAASTTYYLIASVPGAIGASNDQFYWHRTLSTAEDGGGAAGWTIGDTQIVNNAFNNWAAVTTPLEFSVHGSAIPEPSTYAAMAGAAALGLAAWRRRHRKRTANA